VHRRQILKAGALALGSVGLPRLAFAAFEPERAPLLLPRVHVSWDRVVKTTVGLRPHRDAGFVVRGEKLDDRLLVHNYGHGGAGMSLAWGTGSLAADIASDGSARTAAVIGAGAVGLAAARHLQHRGFIVTIYAHALPPDTTSNMSLAGFTPLAGLPRPELRTPAWTRQFTEAAEISFRQLHLFADSSYGVTWMDNYRAVDALEDDDEERDARLLPIEARPDHGREILRRGEHPFPTPYVIRTPTLRIDPHVYLESVLRDFVRDGGTVVVRTFASLEDILTVEEPTIVNCTGLGAAELFGDRDMVPIKGQLTVLLPQPELNYRAGIRVGRGASAVNISMNPRADGVVLGNASERGVWSLEPNEDVRQAIVNAAIKFFGAMREPDDL